MRSESEEYNKAPTKISPSFAGQAALLHLSWWRKNGKRNLLFAWVELLPRGFPPLPGHPFRSTRVSRKSENVVYIGRFPMSGVDALQWFNTARTGDLKLPPHPAQPTPGDGGVIKVAFDENAPSSSSEALIVEPYPFMPFASGPAYARAHFTKPDDSTLKLVSQQKIRDWLEANLFFDIGSHVEFLGSIIFIRYDDDVRVVEQRLADCGKGYREFVRLTLYPRRQMPDVSVTTFDEHPLGLIPPLSIGTNDRLIDIVWHDSPLKTSISLSRQIDGRPFYSARATSYVREIRVGISFPSTLKRVVEEVDANGKPTKFYDVPMVGNPVSTFVARGQDDGLYERTIARRFAEAEASRVSARERSRYGLAWLDKPEDAANEIRLIIRNATDRLIIIDPYMISTDLIRFGLSTSRDIPVLLITSAENLREDKGEAINQQLEKISKRTAALTVKVLPGQRSPLHDRFIIVDNTVWLSGNSLGSIGARDSVVIEIPNSTLILEKLSRYINTSIDLQTWLRQSPSKSD